MANAGCFCDWVGGTSSTQKAKNLSFLMFLAWSTVHILLKKMRTVDWLCLSQVSYCLLLVP